MVSFFDNKDNKRSNIVDCENVEDFQSTIDRGKIAHIDIGQFKEVYGTTEHRENIEVLEMITSEVDIDNCIVIMLDSHHDYYNYSPDKITSGNWVPHAFRLGLLPSPDNPNTETYPFMLVTEKSDDLGEIIIGSPDGHFAWDGDYKTNLPAINGAKGGVSLIPTSLEDEIPDMVEEMIVKTGKKLIVNIDLDFGEVLNLFAEEDSVTRYESMTAVPWIAKLLVLSDIVITNRSPYFNTEKHFKREETEMLEFLQNQAHD